MPLKSPSVRPRVQASGLSGSRFGQIHQSVGPGTSGPSHAQLEAMKEANDLPDSPDATSQRSHRSQEASQYALDRSS